MNSFVNFNNLAGYKLFLYIGSNPEIQEVIKVNVPVNTTEYLGILSSIVSLAHITDHNDVDLITPADFNCPLRRKRRSRKRVKFSRTITEINYIAAEYNEDPTALFWCSSDFEAFRREAFAEVKAYAEVNKLDLRQASKEFYRHA